MKSLAFALVGAAALALTACSGDNQDAVDNAQMNQPAADELNQLSSDAANDAAAEAAALGTQQQQLEQENAVEENTTSPTDEQEQNVSGM